MSKSNPTTTGMDGGDNAGWHDEQHEIDGYALIAVVVLAGVVLAAAATVTTFPPVLVQWWQIVVGLSTAAGVGFLGGVTTMALIAAADYDMDGAE
jgi:hypothetical protein